MFLRQVTVENFRGIEKVTVDLDETTVLIGENNSGKTSFIDALRLSLEKVLARRGNPFDDFDHRLASKESLPRDTAGLSVTLVFCEGKAGEWVGVGVEEGERKGGESEGGAGERGGRFDGCRER